VLELDARDRADRGRYRVGRIEPPAQAHLEHRAVHVQIAEQEQRRGSSRVEERGHRLAACGAQRVHVRAQLLHRGREPFRRDLLAVDPEALGPALEVRRGERSHVRSRGAQHCLCK
jgi:hypothetical protein